MAGPSTILALVTGGLGLAAAQYSYVWKKVEQRGDLRPTGRRDFAIGASQDGLAIAIFGGRSSGTIHSDTWLFNIQNRTWEKVETDPSPPPRFSTVSSSDTARNRFIVSTGESNSDVNLKDAWAFDFESKTWTELGKRGDVQPFPVYGAAGGVIGNSLIVSHGFDNVIRYDDTFQLDFATDRWKRHDLDQRPFARCLVASAALESGILMYGGCGSGGYGRCPSDESWALRVQNADANGTPTELRWESIQACFGSRQFPSASQHPLAPDFAIVFGGSGSTLFPEPNNGEVGIVAFEERLAKNLVPGALGGADQGLPVNRRGAGMVVAQSTPFREADGDLVPAMYMFGGSSSNGIEDDLWVLHVSNKSRNLTSPESAIASEQRDLECRTPFDFYALHGSLMFLSWGFTLPVGLMAARFFKPLLGDPRWFQVHRALQIIGLLISFAGVAIGVIMTGSLHLSIPHHVIGAIVTLLGISQPINAILRPHKEQNPAYKDGKKVWSRRRVWEYLHRYTGRLAWALGMANIVIGTFLARLGTAFTVIVLATQALLLLIYFALTLRGYPKHGPLARKLLGRNES